jgi:hypothetical protein
MDGKAADRQHRYGKKRRTLEVVPLDNDSQQQEL